MNQHTIKYQIWCFYTNLQDFVHFWPLSAGLLCQRWPYLVQGILYSTCSCSDTIVNSTLSLPVQNAEIAQLSCLLKSSYTFFCHRTRGNHIYIDAAIWEVYRYMFDQGEKGAGRNGCSEKNVIFSFPTQSLSLNANRSNICILWFDFRGLIHDSASNGTKRVSLDVPFWSFVEGCTVFTFGAVKCDDNCASMQVLR
jgi:hypothetical protein